MMIPVASYHQHVNKKNNKPPVVTVQKTLQQSNPHTTSLDVVADVNASSLPNGEDAADNNQQQQSSSTSSTSSSTSSKPSFAKILWRFTRPHTIIGSAMAIPSLHLLAAPTLQAAFSRPCAVAMTYAMIPSLLMNLYITGLNQITDVEIDKINKPDLPLAAGLLSQRTATILVVLSLIISLLFTATPYSTPGLAVALAGSAILGTIYSLQPFRLKRFPHLAAFCIVAVRGALINAGFFAHAQAAAFGGLYANNDDYRLDRTHHRPAVCLEQCLFCGLWYCHCSHEGCTGCQG